MVYAAARCRLPKLRVLWGLVRGKRWTEAELFYPPEAIPQVGGLTSVQVVRFARGMSGGLEGVGGCARACAQVSG